MEALHARPDIIWSQCSPTVGSHFWTPESIPSVRLLPKLLETIPILLYAGENDLMCAGIGIENMIERMSWNGAVGFVCFLHFPSAPSCFTDSFKRTSEWNESAGLDSRHEIGGDLDDSQKFDVC